MAWGNQHVEASILGIYSVIQPVVTVIAASLIIALTSPPHYGLVGLGLTLIHYAIIPILGAAIFRALRLPFIIYRSE